MQFETTEPSPSGVSYGRSTTRHVLFVVKLWEASMAPYEGSTPLGEGGLAVHVQTNGHMLYDLMLQQVAAGVRVDKTYIA